MSITSLLLGLVVVLLLGLWVLQIVDELKCPDLPGLGGPGRNFPCLTLVQKFGSQVPGTTIGDAKFWKNLNGSMIHCFWYCF